METANNHYKRGDELRGCKLCEGICAMEIGLMKRERRLRNKIQRLRNTLDDSIWDRRGQGFLKES
jgi:hypothetical protein